MDSEQCICMLNSQCQHMVDKESALAVAPLPGTLTAGIAGAMSLVAAHLRAFVSQLSRGRALAQVATAEGAVQRHHVLDDEQVFVALIRLRSTAVVQGNARFKEAISSTDIPAHSTYPMIT